MRSKWAACVAVVGVLALFGCGPSDVMPSEDASAGDMADADAEAGEAPSSDLPSEDPRWCVEAIEGSQLRVPMTDVDNECDAELTAEACEANPNCTAMFGRPIQCPESGACATAPVEFLGCIPFTVCKPGPGVYCREMQGYLLTYASQQGDCTPFWMMDCLTEPNYAASGEPPPDCG